MKRTEDGLHWVHVNCALWIPETGFKNVLKMEPIHGVEVISSFSFYLFFLFVFFFLNQKLF